MRAQLSILQARPDFASLRQQIQAIASALEDQSAIPAIKAERLFQSSFTDINSQGPLGLFAPAGVSTLVNVLQEIRTRAVA